MYPYKCFNLITFEATGVPYLRLIVYFYIILRSQPVLLPSTNMLMLEHKTDQNCVEMFVHYIAHLTSVSFILFITPIRKRNETKMATLKENYLKNNFFLPTFGLGPKFDRVALITVSDIKARI